LTNFHKIDIFPSRIRKGGGVDISSFLGKRLGGGGNFVKYRQSAGLRDGELL
jgi:hypothetical protein